jgi:hypothetical protein
MTTRLIPQALALGLAGVVTLAVLGGIDRIAVHTEHAALVAHQQAQPAPVAAAAQPEAGTRQPG